MIRWSTPTLPVVVRSVDLTPMAGVVVTFVQGCARVEIEDPPMEYDGETGCTTLYPTLSQIQTAWFRPGVVEVQVNAIDRAGFRVPSDIATFHMGSNLLDRPLSLDGSGSPDIPPGGIIPTGNITITANGEGIDVTSYATATVDVPQETTGVALVTYDLNGAEGRAPNGEAFAMRANIDGTYYFTKARLVQPRSQTDERVSWELGHYATIPDGKTYDGWSTDPEATEGYYDMPVMLTGNTTVYAVWVDE